jgi:membrane-bound serine protease (ClpP class)
MSTQVISLLAAGLVLLGFEVLVPGAILGILGGFLLLAGVGLAFFSEGMSGGVQALAVALAGVGLMMWFEFRVMPRTRIGKRMFLSKAIDGTSQPPVAAQADAVVGREATAETALSPTGIVLVDGRRYEARCDSGFAAEGARLRVTRIETFQLVVIALD